MDWPQSDILGADLIAKRADVVQSIIYKYLATVDAGVDHEAAIALAGKANLDAVLQCKELGGQLTWTAEEFITEDVWETNGGKAGLKGCAKKLLTLVAAAGRKEGPLNPICKVCPSLDFT